MENNIIGDLEKHLVDIFEILSSNNSATEIHGFGSERFDAVAYKRNYSFLREGLRDSYLLKTDNTVIPEARLCSHKGVYFVARRIDPDLTLNENTLILNRIQESDFLHCSIETVMGYLVGSSKEDYDVMIHSHSDGIELASISRRAPSKLRANLSTLTARTFSELHNRNIIYSDPVPTNIKYDFTDRILLNPHQHIVFNSAGEEDWIRDLALFVKTNSWLPNQERFLQEYARTRSSHIEWKLLNIYITDYLEMTNFGTELEPGIVPYWTQE